MTCGLPCTARRALGRLDERGHIVAVAFEHVPVERAIFIGERLERHDVFGAAVDLNEVAIDDRGEVVEFELCAGHHRLPMQSALMLGIRRDDPDVKIFAVHLRAKRHSGALRETFAERTRGRLDRRKRNAFGMALKPRSELPQRQQLLDRKVSEVRHRRVANRRDVAAREQQPIAIGPLRIGRIVPHQVPVERGKDVGHIERAGRMAGTGRKQRADDALAHVVGLELQLGQALGGKALHGSRYTSWRAGPTAGQVAGQGGPGKPNAGAVNQKDKIVRKLGDTVPESVTLTVGGRTMVIETGELAKQANGSALVRYGDQNVVLCAVTASEKPREGIDFFPLTCDFEEKMYAAGKIPGGYIKREGRPPEHAVLSSRQIDRPIRPLFPDGFRNDVQIVATVLSIDPELDADVLGVCAAGRGARASATFRSKNRRRGSRRARRERRVHLQSDACRSTKPAEWTS